MPRPRRERTQPVPVAHRPGRDCPAQPPVPPEPGPWFPRDGEDDREFRYRDPPTAPRSPAPRAAGPVRPAPVRRLPAPVRAAVEATAVEWVRRAATVVPVGCPGVAGSVAPTAAAPGAVRAEVVAPAAVPTTVDRVAGEEVRAVPTAGAAAGAEPAAVPTGHPAVVRHGVVVPAAVRGVEPVVRPVPTGVRSRAAPQVVPTVDHSVRGPVVPTSVVPTSAGSTWEHRRSVHREAVPIVDRSVVRTWEVLTSVRREVAPIGPHRARPRSVRREVVPIVDRDPAAQDRVGREAQGLLGPAARGRVDRPDCPEPSPSTARNAASTRAREAAAAVADFRPGATAWAYPIPVRTGHRAGGWEAGWAGRSLRPAGTRRPEEQAAHRIADTAAHPVSVGYRMPHNCCCPSAGLQAEVYVYRHDAVALEPSSCRRLSTVPYRRNVGVGRPGACPCLIRLPQCHRTASRDAIGPGAKGRRNRRHAAGYRCPTPACHVRAVMATG